MAKFKEGNKIWFYNGWDERVDAKIIFADDEKYRYVINGGISIHTATIEKFDDARVYLKVSDILKKL